LPLLAVLYAPGLARAAPAADLVVVWAPGAKIAPVVQAARAHGAAVIDRSPTPPAAIETGKILQRAIEAYDALRYDEARAALDQARDLVDRTGAAGLSTAQLSDLFLYRGLVRVQTGDATGAWDELVASVVVAPERVLDRGRFPPNIVELFERARDETRHKQPPADLQIATPDGCTAYVDGVAAAGKLRLIAGLHWARTECIDRAPWGSRVDLPTTGLSVRADPLPYAPPPDADALVQARVSLAHAVIITEVHGTVATARKLSLDGRELDRRTVNVTGDLQPLALAIGDMLTPEKHSPWYQSKWAWAGAAAAVTAIVLVPITAAIAGGSTPTTFTVHPKGLPPL